MTNNDQGEPRWEPVCHSTFGPQPNQHVRFVTSRLPVPGGWLYRTTSHAYAEFIHDGPVNGMAMVFVPEVKG